MKKTKVSIIISNYNYGEYVLDAIESALNQTHPCHVVIVDDGSTDDSFQKIYDYLAKTTFTSSDISNINMPYYKGKVETYRNNKCTFKRIRNSGASTARNVGIWSVWNATNVFAILDADDTYKPEKVEILLNKLLEYDDIGVAYSDYYIHRPLYNKIEYKPPYNKEHLFMHCLVHSGALIKKEYLEKAILQNREFYDSKLHGPSSEEFIGCTEDYDLWLRLSDLCMMCHVPKPLSDVREDGRNQSMKMTSEIFQKNIQIMKSR